MHILNCGKEWPKMWGSFLISKKLPKANNHPMGKNSPNLVTLAKAIFSSNSKNTQEQIVLATWRSGHRLCLWK
jgi:hypothetical protein